MSRTDHSRRTNKTELGFRLKVVFSYVLLVVVIAVTVLYVYRRVYPVLFTGEQQQDNIMERSLLVSTAISQLYEAEWLGTRFIQDARPDHYELYKNALAQVDSILDTLTRVTTVVRQRMIIGQIDSLILHRDSNIQEIARQQAELTRRSAEEVQRRVDQALAPLPTLGGAQQASEGSMALKPSIIVREEIVYDTIKSAVQQPRQNVLQRLGGLLAGARPQKDSVVEIRQFRRTITDTLLRVIPGTSPPDSAILTTRDTVRQAVRRVFDDVEAQRQRQIRVLSQQLDLLIENDRALNQQINKLLEELNTEWFHSAASVLETRRSSLQQASTYIMVVGGVALFIMLVFCASIFVDLNKSRRYRRDLEASRSHAEELMKSREKLLLTVTHDIKAPLSSIVGYLDLLRQPSDVPRDQQLDAYLEPMTHSAAHVMELLGNLLEYYRLEAQKLQLRNDVTPLRKTVEDTLAVFAPTVQKKGVSLHLITTVSPQLCIETDAVHWQQIMMNLLSNAVKFTDKGHIDVLLELHREDLEHQEVPPAADGRAQLYFCVEDTGCGISSEMQSAIFEEFMRVDQPRDAAKEGVGLGLSIVKRLVDAFQGTITVAPRAGGGSTFCVSMPVVVSSIAAQDVITSSGQHVDQPSLSDEVWFPLRVLVVDDEDGQVQMTSEMLRRAHCLMLTCGSMEQALARLEAYHVDVVLTDIQMPRGDGFELLQRIKQRPFGAVPVIAVTANGLFSPSEFLEKGFAALLPKPFVGTQLEAVLAPFRRRNVTNLFDLRHLATMMHGDLESVLPVLEVFAPSARESVVQMEQALEQDRFEEIRKLAHKMLPMFRQLESPLVQELVLLERSTQLDADTTRYVVAQVRQLVAALEAYLHPEITASS